MFTASLFIKRIHGFQNKTIHNLQEMCLANIYDPMYIFTNNILMLFVHSLFPVIIFYINKNILLSVYSNNIIIALCHPDCNIQHYYCCNDYVHC